MNLIFQYTYSNIICNAYVTASLRELLFAFIDKIYIDAVGSPKKDVQQHTYYHFEFQMDPKIFKTRILQF